MDISVKSFAVGFAGGLLHASLVIAFVKMTIFFTPLFEAYREIMVAGGGWVTP